MGVSRKRDESRKMRASVSFSGHLFCDNAVVITFVTSEKIFQHFFENAPAPESTFFKDIITCAAF